MFMQRPKNNSKHTVIAVYFSELFNRKQASVADLGFPRGGGANIRFCQNFPKTAIERIWTRGGHV